MNSVCGSVDRQLVDDAVDLAAECDGADRRMARRLAARGSVIVRRCSSLSSTETDATSSQS